MRISMTFNSFYVRILLKYTMVTPEMKLTIIHTVLFKEVTLVGTRFRETYAYDNTNTRNTESRNNS